MEGNIKRTKYRGWDIPKGFKLVLKKIRK